MVNFYLTENDYWNVIEDINWFELSKLYDRETACDKVGEFCTTYLTLDEIINLENFIVEKRKNLMKKLYNLSELKISDDRTWDLASHIVGLGQNVYYLVMKYPKIALELVNESVENFEYGFTKAVYDMKEKELEII